VLLVTSFSAATALAQESVSSFSIAGYEVEVSGDLGGFSLAVETRELEPGLEVAQLRLTRPTAAAPQPFSLKWSLPSHDIQGQWTSSSYFNKSLNPDWYPSSVKSMLARNAPVMTLFGSDDHNRLTFAVSDALNVVLLKAGVREEDGLIYGQIDFFTEKHRVVSNVDLAVLFDRRAMPYHEALRNVTAWWAAQPGYTPAAVPDVARLPMYSTWYSYHQSVAADALLREVEIAKQLGFQAIIVDDGWQTLDSRRGYAYTGDWAPERIPDMTAFVAAVHERGMKILLWYAVPLVGERSRAYPLFQGKYLRYWNGQGAYELDPRYPDVREHIIETYRTALREWNVDGFKLDFMGRFVANDSTVLEATQGRDFASVNEATDRLMTDIMAELRELKPDIMVEFRQPYIGPLMRKYGNMFRAGDAPNAGTANRVRTVDLRLLSGTTAVHSDMIMWHYDEPVEIAAFQLLNIIFSVPQVSVRLEDIPDDHREMIRFYTDYWTRNRSVLLDGMFEARYPLANYPLLIGYDREKQILATYSDVVVPLDAARPTERIDILNAKPSERLLVDVAQALGRYRYTITDSQGWVRETGEVSLEVGTHSFTVTVSGMIALERIGGEP
jgi:alpha-galactosidase